MTLCGLEGDDTANTAVFASNDGRHGNFGIRCAAKPSVQLDEEQWVAVYRRYKIESELEVEERWSVEVEDHTRLGRDDSDPMVELKITGRGDREVEIMLTHPDLDEIIEILQAVSRGE